MKKVNKNYVDDAAILRSRRLVSLVDTRGGSVSLRDTKQALRRVALAALIVCALVNVCACASEQPVTVRDDIETYEDLTTQATESDAAAGGYTGDTVVGSYSDDEADSASSADNMGDTAEGGGEPMAPTQSDGSPAPSTEQDAVGGNNAATPVDVTTTVVSAEAVKSTTPGTESTTDAPTKASAETPAEIQPDGVTTAQLTSSDGLASDLSAIDVYTEVAEAATAPEMFQVPDDLIMDFYGIDSTDYASAVFMLCADSLLADEFVIARAVDQAAADRLLSRLEARMSLKADEARTYSPEQFAVIDSCTVTKDGLWVALIVSPDAAAFRNAYSAAIS